MKLQRGYPHEVLRCEPIIHSMSLQAWLRSHYDVVHGVLLAFLFVSIFLRVPLLSVPLLSACWHGGASVLLLPARSAPCYGSCWCTARCSANHVCYPALRPGRNGEHGGRRWRPRRLFSLVSPVSRFAFSQRAGACLSFVGSAHNNCQTLAQSMRRQPWHRASCTWPRLFSRRS